LVLADVGPLLALAAPDALTTAAAAVALGAGLPVSGTARAPILPEGCPSLPLDFGSLFDALHGVATKGSHKNIPIGLLL